MNYLVNADISEEIDGCETDPLTGNIIGAAIDVDRALGPGLLELCCVPPPHNQLADITILK